MESRRGHLLGRYEIVAEIGRGAMGAVYQARDPKIDRFVAIKTILLHQSGLREQEEFRQRFFTEAKAAGRLLHPGIVTVFDVGEEPETSDPYIVMEYIEGQTLRDLLAGETKRLPLERALEITEEIAEALNYAHSQGVVHRDIKPANILITKEGQAKIGDFGIAQLDLSHITLPGHVVGTPAYMSPEQLEGAQVDGRSDLFSLGAIFYSMLTGFSPFQGSSATTVCFKVMNRNPLQVTTLAPELPAQLDVVMGRALAKDRAHRYQNGAEFADDLRELRKHVANRAKAKLWFSPPESRKRFLDGTAKFPVPAVVATVAKAPSVSTPAPAKRRQGPSSILSLSPVQTGVAALTLLFGSIALAILGWRELRNAGPSPSAIADARVSRVPDVATSKPAPALSTADSNPKLSAEIPLANGNQTVTQATDAIATDSVVQLSRAGSGAGSPMASKSGTPKTGRDRIAAAGNAVSSVPKAATKASIVAVPTKSASNATPSPSETSQPSAVFADSNLAIHVENHFADATLAIWIDSHLAYEHSLHDGHKKRLILLGGGVRESLTMPLAAGKHTLKIQVRSASEQYDQSKTLDGDFVKGGEKILSVNFDKHTKEMRIALGSEALASPKLQPAQ